MCEWPFRVYTHTHRGWEYLHLELVLFKMVSPCLWDHLYKISDLWDSRKTTLKTIRSKNPLKTYYENQRYRRIPAIRTRVDSCILKAQLQIHKKALAPEWEILMTQKAQMSVPLVDTLRIQLPIQLCKSGLHRFCHLQLFKWQVHACCTQFQQSQLLLIIF